jgi:hypothetical protein
VSRLIPQRVIDGLRQIIDVSTDLAGIDCTLYIPTNYNEVQKEDAYAHTALYEYAKYTCRVIVTWKPSTYRLKKLGVFVEDELPILVTLPQKATNKAGALVNVDIIQHSYIAVSLEHVPDNKTMGNEFELVDQAIRGMHDAEITRIWKAVPRRREVFKSLSQTA